MSLLEAEQRSHSGASTHRGPRHQGAAPPAAHRRRVTSVQVVHVPRSPAVECERYTRCITELQRYESLGGQLVLVCMAMISFQLLL